MMREILRELGVVAQRGRWGTKGLTLSRVRQLCRVRKGSWVSRQKFAAFCQETGYDGEHA
jgi:hypothetical protein